MASLLMTNAIDPNRKFIDAGPHLAPLGLSKYQPCSPTMRAYPVVMTLMFLVGCGARDEAPRGELLAGAGAAVEKPRGTFSAYQPGKCS